MRIAIGVAIIIVALILAAMWQRREARLRAAAAFRPLTIEETFLVIRLYLVRSARLIGEEMVPIFNELMRRFSDGIRKLSLRINEQS